MEKRKTGSKLVVEYHSYVNDPSAGLRELKKELEYHRHLDGFITYIEDEWAFICEGCGREHTEERLICHCVDCGVEMCDYCCYTDDHDQPVCESCCE